MAACEFFIASLHHYSCLCNNCIKLFMHFVKCALEFCKVRIKVSSIHSKASRTCFLFISHCHHPPLHCIALHCLILTFRTNYDANCHSFSTWNIDLHFESTRIFGCCARCLVILIVPVDSRILCVKSTECKLVMSCLDVWQSLISVHSNTT